MIKVIKGPDNKEVIAKIENINKITEFGIRQAWFKVGQDLIRSANKAILKRPRQGRVYIIRGRSGRRRRHRASRPGESHANLTGQLRKSIGWKVRGFDLEYGYGVVRRAPPYAKFLEDGTRKMEPRPSLENSIKENIRNTQQHLENAVAKEFNT